MTGYIEKVQQLIGEAGEAAVPVLKGAAGELAARLSRGGIIQLFGSGHSQLLAQEGFYRAGSLVPVRPISIGPLMLHEGAVSSSMYEKDPAFSRSFLDKLDIRPEDAVIIISTSGRNPVPLDVAEYAAAQGAYTVSLQSLRYTEQEHPSRHASGRRLEELVAAVLDTQVPPGDAVMQVGGVQCGPVSSVIGNTLLHALFCETVAAMEADGRTPPVFKSGNLEGNAEYNEKLVAAYSGRIKF
ncbi:MULTISPECIES: sugar isomerase domain-containing protein [Sporosarcina]|uniref:sugar isomerase domain-containing protein n=1 Tax=Sporosarcina TaxID=1569 RepID=UPI000590ED68|nr:MULTISPECIES: SIS domain-containing protein [Sporosarcina]WJY26918.1 SIS domain-containing protein [Sporosarcina sp. 0.2-SM1T-5]